MPLPGDGFAAAVGLEPAARYDVADQMGLDSFSADTAGAAALPGADSVPLWAGVRRHLQQSGASTCIGNTFTVVSVRLSCFTRNLDPNQSRLHFTQPDMPWLDDQVCTVSQRM